MVAAWGLDPLGLLFVDKIPKELSTGSITSCPETALGYTTMSLSMHFETKNPGLKCVSGLLSGRILHGMSQGLRENKNKK